MKKLKRRKQQKLGPSPEELLAEMPASGAGRPMRGTRKPTKIYRPHENDKLKAKRDRREWVTKVCKGDKRYQSCPPNIVLIYMQDDPYDAILSKHKKWFSAVDAARTATHRHRMFNNGLVSRGTDVFIVRDSNIRDLNITHVTHCEQIVMGPLKIPIFSLK